ncbi:MAG: hypothetical protein LBP24_04175 [Coriobacteriales bacterium]|jgi:hypothetical protein|nr:hypothetical protein [Coriobacteriales bacterium]
MLYRKAAAVAITLVVLALTLGGCMKPLDTGEYLYEGLKVSTFEEYKREAKPFFDNPKDYVIASEKGLGDPERYSERYMELQAYYRKALEVHLLEVLRLDLYEEEFATSKLGFMPESDKHMSYQQRYSMLKLDHLYLRNDLYIGHLSTEDIALLEALHAQNGAEVTPEAVEFAKRTYPEVIWNYDIDGKPYDASRDLQFEPGTTAPPNALMIAFCNPSHFTEEGEFDSTNADERAEFILKRLPEIKAEMEAKLPVPVAVLLTDWSSVDFITPC